MSTLYFKTEKLKENPSLLVFGVFGHIDSDSIPKLQEKLYHLQEEGIAQFILDMGHLKRINSTGLGILVNTFDRLERAGIQSCLVRVNPPLNRIMQVLGLYEFFRVFSGMMEGIAFFLQQTPNLLPSTLKKDPKEIMVAFNELQRRGATYPEIVDFLFQLESLEPLADNIFPILSQGVDEQNWNLLMRTAYLLTVLQQLHKNKIPLSLI